MATSADAEGTTAEAIAGRIEDAIYLLAQLAVELRSARLAPQEVEADMRKVFDALRAVERRRAEPLHEAYAVAICDAVAGVYAREKQSPMDEDSYELALRDALATLGIELTEHEVLHLSVPKASIEDTGRHGSKTGPIETAMRQLAPFVNSMIERAVAPRLPHDESSPEARAMLLPAVEKLRHLRQQAAARKPVVFASRDEVRAYLATLAMDDVERASEEIRSWSALTSR